MTDLVQLQEDITLGLQSWDALANINIVQDRKLRLQQQTDAALICLALRNGRKGCGVLVEMPTIEVPHQAAPGPQTQLVVTAAVVEDPTINLAAKTGTLLDAETVARFVLMFLHGWLLEGKGELFADQRAIEPTRDFPGKVAYRVACPVKLQDTVMQRLSTPSIAEPTPLTLSLTSDNPDAEIYYTTDGSFPGQANPVAVQYADPFAVEAGTLVRWAAFKPGLLPSAVGSATIN